MEPESVLRATGHASGTATAEAVGATAQGGVGGGGGGKRTTTRRSSTGAFVYGRIKVKIYPVTMEKLDNLARLDLLAGAFFSAATGLFGFSVSITRDLMLAAGVAKEKLQFWAGVDATALVVALVCLGFAIKFWKDRGTKLKSIENETTFDE